MIYRNIEDSPIWSDVKKIVYSGKKAIKHTFKGMLHTEKENIPLLRLSNIDTVHDYVNNISDRKVIEFILPLGDYINKLFPYRANLEVTIKKIELQEASGSKEKDTIITTERFKAIFIPNSNLKVSASDVQMVDHDTLNMANMVTVVLELINRSIEPLRIKRVKGIYRNVTQKQLIHNIFSMESNKVIIDGKPSIDSIDIVPPDNTELKKHIILPDGLHLTALPTYLQEHMGGVYNAGIGTYLQTYKNKKTWFIYPLFNTKRFKRSKTKVIFISIPNNKLKGIDRTYNIEGDVISILVTSNRAYHDNAETEFMNDGVGFIMADARAFMKKPVLLTQDGPKASRTNLVHESSVQDRKDGLNYASVSSRVISSNPFREYSKVNLRNTSRIDILWENADPDILYPGLPCQYIFLDKGKVVSLDGTILHHHSLSGLQGFGLANNIYRTNSQVTIAVEKLPESTNTDTYAQSHGDF